MIPKPTLHSLAQKFKAMARLARINQVAHNKRKLWKWADNAAVRSETLDECASEIEKLKQ